MPEGAYHKRIKEAIFKIASKSNKHKKVFKERKIPIPHPKSSVAPIMYLPEVYIVTKHGKKYIFEILDSQSKDYNLIIADIIQSYLVENVSAVFFITKDNKDYELATRLADILGAKLEENGYNKKDLPDVTLYQISKEDAADDAKLNAILLDYAKRDRWV